MEERERVLAVDEEARDLIIAAGVSVALKASGISFLVGVLVGGLVVWVA